jgi:NadR type nicotinamide-nucleotide adenylyltransferase
MAALPPTLGHADLIRFAGRLSGQATVLLVTRGQEPYRRERVAALQEHFALTSGIAIEELHLEGLTAEGNSYWADILCAHGFQPGDYLVASEAWGEEIAEALGGEFFPYDLAREVRYTKATAIRNDLDASWEWIIPEFQKRMQKRIVIFGAESTGKTTLMRELRNLYPASVGLFEYARPLLEVRSGALDEKKMLAIWRGQRALQEATDEFTPVPRTVFLDTDLYTTLGYWQFWSPATVPEGLAEDAKLLKADLYLFVTSAIPFEADPIRLGGDRREQPDTYWRGVLEEHNLPYVEITANNIRARLIEAQKAINPLLAHSLSYERQDLDQ